MDPRARDATYADKLCEDGHYGQKTGKGYYVYEAGKRGGIPNPDVMPLIEAERVAQGITPREFTDGEIVRRYMASMVNEAAKVVGEGIARRPLDVDMTLLFGYGFPRYRGWPAEMGRSGRVARSAGRYPALGRGRRLFLGASAVCWNSWWPRVAALTI